jgi:DNA-binding NtrC family response regulator
VWVVQLKNMTAEQIAGPTTRRHRILIVDDEAAIRSLLTDLFTDAGYEVYSAANAADAMALCATKHFDLLLSDVRMPGMNGHQLVREVMVEYPDMRCCLMSGCDLECSDCGRAPRPCTLLPKPFKPHEAIALIAKILGGIPVS